MKTIIQILLICSIYIPSLTHAQADNFNYSTTVALILQDKNGGHIFQRPDYDEPRNYFMLTYGIVGKYAVQMQPQHDGLTLDISSLPIEERIILINHETQKTLFLGDHWIGDGERFSIMKSDDYHRLKEYFSGTRKVRGEPTPIPALDVYTGNIHQTWTNDPDDFYREYYFPDPKPIPNTQSLPTEKPTARNNSLEDKTEIAETEEKTTADNSPTKTTAKKAERENEKQQPDISKNDANNVKAGDITSTQGASSLSRQDEKLTDNDSNYWLWSLVVALLLVVGFWWYRQAN